MDFSKIDRNEIYRYMGQKGHEPSEEIKQNVEAVICELKSVATPRYCVKKSKLNIEDITVKLDFFNMISKSLALHLDGCKSVIMLAATIGSDVDRIIYKYSMLSPVNAVISQAVAATMIEYYADDVCKSLEAEADGFLTERFSPGYGDLSMDYQKNILDVLNASKRIGLCLTDGKLLTPVKSITAVVGISDVDKKCKTHKCNECNNYNCAFRN